jgi:hypothetical protein
LEKQKYHSDLGVFKGSVERELKTYGELSAKSGLRLGPDEMTRLRGPEARKVAEHIEAVASNPNLRRLLTEFPARDQSRFEGAGSAGLIIMLDGETPLARWEVHVDPTAGGNAITKILHGEIQPYLRGNRDYKAATIVDFANAHTERKFRMAFDDAVRSRLDALETENRRLRGEIR